ncbi:MAG TPA: DUF3999 family protein [Candidatus Saccharimonadales bacterium]|jgi:hypothetical protein|nr:DUF3999 family protein [Candidatus Saccharimonadales bacterium]
MRTALKLLALMMMMAGAPVAYFQYERPVPVAAAGGQNYVVIDETLWNHSRAGLDDLRLYAGDIEIPYAILTERGSSEHATTNIRVLQPGTIGGKTQFFLDMAGLAEYDRIELALAARDFVVKAEIQGQDDLHGPNWVALGRTVLYDLSGDHLGGNNTLRLPVTAYKYLRVTVDGQVKPADIQGASASVRHEEKEVWRLLGGAPTVETKGKDNIFTFNLASQAPVERIEFVVDPAQPDFLRSVEVENQHHERLGSGEISRIHTVRHGQKIDAEQTSLSVYTAHTGTVRIIVRNGDDQPLKITAVRLQQYERRLYFTPSAAGALRLYYGDAKLPAPVYDYARLFQKDARAAESKFGPEQANSLYTGRPDERPWSERHPAVLWMAIVLAVIVLGAVALRSMRTATA